MLVSQKDSDVNCKQPNTLLLYALLEQDLQIREISSTSLLLVDFDDTSILTKSL